MRVAKLELSEEKMRLDAVLVSNKKVEESIKTFELRSAAWQTQKNQDITKFQSAIEELERVDIQTELENHKRLAKHTDDSKTLRNLEKEKSYHEDSLTKATRQKEQTVKDLEYAEKATCPTCEQDLHGGKHEHLVDELKKDLKEQTEYEKTLSAKLKEIQNSITAIGDLGSVPDTYYDSIDEAYNHKGSVEDLKRQLEQTRAKENPYQEQIDELNKTAVQKIDYTRANEMEDLYRHQEFLYKLLTAKDSFIRTRIIEQNLTYLNQRLAFYLTQVKLPHTVVFLSDLNVRIEELGRELDFDNLSRGERNRLILSLSWAFRDVWEGLYQQINLLFIDELIDAGMDVSGVESSMAVLKEMSRTQSKNIFLISHKDELVSRVNSVLKVVKENGFTSYANDVDIII